MDLPPASPPAATPAGHEPPGPELPAAAAPIATAPIRIGYARTSTATQELASQLDVLARAGCTRVFSEQISTRVKVRPELEAALTLVTEIKTATATQPVILCVHEMKASPATPPSSWPCPRPCRPATSRSSCSPGRCPGSTTRMAWARCCSVLAVAAQRDRDYIREETLEGQAAAAARGNHGGRPPVSGDDMLVFARARRARGTPMPETAAKLTIATGKNAGAHPSVASIYLGPDPAWRRSGAGQTTRIATVDQRRELHRPRRMAHQRVALALFRASPHA